MSEIFELTDYRLAGFLESRGAPFVGTRRNEKDETVFLFEGGEKTSALVDAYGSCPERKYDAACKAMYAMTQVRRRKRP